MDIENLIRDTLTEHEHVAPDGDAVFAAARQRIDRRRTVLTRPLAVAAGVAVLTLAAVTVVALNRPDPTSSVPVAEAPSSQPADAPPAIADLTMPYTLEWLPPGEVEYLARRINIGGSTEEPLYGGEYMLTVTADDQVLNVDVQQFRMVPVEDAAFKSGPGNPLTIGGQPAVESANSDGPGGYELYVAHPDGGSMYVNIAPAPGSSASAQQLVDTGRQLAENITFPGTTTVTPTYGVRDLPNGMRICTFAVERGIDSPGVNTSYELGTCTTMPPIHVSTAIASDLPGTPGEPVQGHETRYVNEDGYHRLWVLDAVDGAPVSIAGKVPPADLYEVANHLVLP